MFKRMALLLAAWILSAGLALADGRVHVLALEGDGSASLVLDEEAATAYIHDGGRAEAKGIAGARVNGEPVLAFLKSRGIETVVISCSHPHDDHMGGLVTLMQDSQLRSFKKLYFVDSIADNATTRSGKPILPLHKVFADLWKDGPPPEVKFARAVNADAFAELGIKAREVRARNFAYDPSQVGGDVHDTSVITEFEIRDAKGNKRLVVDFDDASSSLIKLWAKAKPARKANVLLMAHHGSRYNDMSPVLEQQKAIGLTDVVFTVNDGNKFLHPTPEALRMAAWRSRPSARTTSTLRARWRGTLWN